MSIDIIKYEDLVWGRFLGRGAEGPVHACMYLDTPVAVKQTSSSTELEMNLSTGGPSSAWLEWAGSAGRCMLAYKDIEIAGFMPQVKADVKQKVCGSGPLLHAPFAPSEPAPARSLLSALPLPSLLVHKRAVAQSGVWQLQTSVWHPEKVLLLSLCLLRSLFPAGLQNNDEFIGRLVVAP